MEHHWLLLWTLLCSFLPLTISSDQASFYGSSYISIPLKEAKSSTDVHFKFRTHLPNTLLFLVTGSIDHCMVKLDNGRLKVEINLGAGLSELYNSHAAKLNDFKWHKVFITRKEANLSVIIDDIYTVNKRLPGKFFELNINHGLFVGSWRDNGTDIFFGKLENFRGCLSQVMYNGILVLDQARRRQSQAIVQGVTWNCAAEFESPVDRPISFVEDGSFMAIPHPISHTLKLQTELKTLMENSIVFYNPGQKLDLFALEIFKGKLKVILKHGDKIVETISDEYISDGHWHEISIKITVNSVELIVGSRKQLTKIARGHVIEFTDTFYIGGIELSKQSRAMSRGLRTADTSYKGCIRHLVIGDRQKGLPNVHVSEGLLPGCVWQYPCLSNPCHDNGVCTQQGLDSFQCNCAQESCFNPNYTETNKVLSHTSFATELELLSLKPLEANEGQNVLITTQNLHMILDYPKYGIRDVGIKFKMIEFPAHGSISIDVWPHEKNVFTLADVARDKINYVHDGSETLSDHFVLEVEFSATDLFILPAYLQGKFKFTLPVNVAPVNDPPALKISSDTVLRIPQGTKKIIDSSLLQVNDPDSVEKQLVFNILDSGSGHFEFTQQSGQPISSFTHQDVLNHDVLFVHHASGANESYISLQVSDGIETSPAIKLRVSAFLQYWRLKNNTGIILMHLTSAIITPFNLSFVSNVANATDSAQFHLVEGPKFGAIEVEKDVGIWENSVIFTSDDLRQHGVRYRHLASRPDFDEFQFRTTLNMSMLYTFRMTFAKCHLYPININTLTLNGTSEVGLTIRNLKYQTDPVESATTSIIYQIIKAPFYGYFFSAVSKYQMRTQDIFTQEDILLQNVKFRFFRKSYSPILDNVLFNIIAPGCKNVTENLTIVHFPENDIQRKVKVYLEKLQVVEGNVGKITASRLQIHTEFVTDMIFNVTELPSHGILQINKNNQILRNSTNYFTLNDLQNNQLLYVHDDSETRHDSFNFMALSNDEENFEYVDTFRISIKLKNDNGPTRTVDQLFHVVVGSERILSANDLCYSDKDLDTKPSDIKYTFRELPNGEFNKLTNRDSKITEFTQEDLDKNAVLFKHKGPEYGKIKFWVTDGDHHVSGVLEVQASAPFIRAIMNKRLIVQHGKSAIIVQQYLDFSTNLYAVEEDVIYELKDRPNFGKLLYTDSTKEVTEFNQAQINNGLISYVNEITTSSADEIGLKIRCRDASNVAQLGVWMLPASYWEPLVTKTAKTLMVEESTSAIISKLVLEVGQQNVPPNAIIYHISQLPENGYISILPTAQNIEDQSMNVRSFTQSFMNENRIIYIQSVANETQDSIAFNITNGMVWLNDIVLDIQIIPERLYLGSNILNVNEGGNVLISVPHLFIITDYYKTRVTDYVILEEPKFGCIQVHKRCNKNHGFSQKEFAAGLVQYAHNGSENLHDMIILIAIAGEKRSIPVILNIKILPVNDQKPKLINNTGLVMWEGGTTVITSTMLGASDADRPQDSLKYQILGCWWGNVSLLTDPYTSLKYFTQELIDKNMVAFRHQNGSEAKFTFNISDGLHSTKEYTFNIKAKPVILSLIHRPLHIFPLQRKYLSSTHLLSTISDPDRQIYYEVTKSPALGRLMMESDKSPGMFTVVTGFTQEELNNSRVFYEHTHPFADLYANDSFIFNIRSHLAQPLLNKKLKIYISVSSGGLDAYVTIPKVTVDEGGAINIILNFSGVVSFLENHAGLRAPIIHASALLPQHGQIFLQNHPNVTRFTQQQLESAQVQYQHDHSDSLGDNLYFSLYLLPSYIILCNITVPVIINPINDQPFKLVTPAPHLIVVQGENHTITKHELCTEDVDTPPSDLLYDIISGPQEGKVILLPEGIPINHFSQADIDQNKLVYVHNSTVLTDTFHLRVWDTKFRPEYTVFNVKVLPINLNVSGGLPVYIQQGMNVVLLTDKQFFVETNTDRKKIQFKIRDLPKHGVVFVRDNVSDEFEQEDIDNDSVMYMQRDMTTANDSFRVFVGIIYANLSIGKEIDVFIRVQPLMQIGNCTFVAGETNRLSLHVLDATPLAKLTNSNPKYIITYSPQFGQVRKIIRSSGEHRNVLDTTVNSFTHEEVQSGLIYVVVNDIEVGWSGTLDRLGFILAASIFQPAIAELKIVIRSSLHNDIYSTLAGPNDPAGHEGGMHFASPNMTRDYFLIVSMVAGVVILGVAVIIIIKCRSFEPEELNKEDQCLQPIPLPRPPDRLMASVQNLKQIDEYASPVPATLPHCKVTPLSRNDIDIHGRYPYGVDEHIIADDWSSCDASDPTCPSRNNIMLRRNQYWV